MFCGQAPVAEVLVTMVVHEDPVEGTDVLLMGIPTASPGVRRVETWDALGMRATSSHDVVLEDVAVAEAQIVTCQDHSRPVVGWAARVVCSSSSVAR